MSKPLYLFRNLAIRERYEQLDRNYNDALTSLGSFYDTALRILLDEDTRLSSAATAESPPVSSPLSFPEAADLGRASGDLEDRLSAGSDVSLVIGANESSAGNLPLPNLATDLVPPVPNLNDTLIDRVTRNYHAKMGDSVTIGGSQVYLNQKYTYRTAAEILNTTHTSLSTLVYEGRLFRSGYQGREAFIFGDELIRHHRHPHPQRNYLIQEVAELLYTDNATVGQLISAGVLEVNPKDSKIIFGHSVKALFDLVHPQKNSERYAQVKTLLSSNDNPAASGYTAPASGSAPVELTGVNIGAALGNADLASIADSTAFVVPLIDSAHTVAAQPVQIPPKPPTGPFLFADEPGDKPDTPKPDLVDLSLGKDLAARVEPFAPVIPSRTMSWILQSRFPYRLTSEYVLNPNADVQHPDAEYIRFKSEQQHGTRRGSHRTGSLPDLIFLHPNDTERFELTRMYTKKEDFLRMLNEDYGVSNESSADNLLSRVGSGTPMYRGRKFYPQGAIKLVSLNEEDLKWLEKFGKPYAAGYGYFVREKDIASIVGAGFKSDELLRNVVAAEIANMQFKGEPRYNLLQALAVFKQEFMADHR